MDFTRIFIKVAKSYPEYEDALKIVKANSKRRIWLVGGFVCRSIIKELYGVPMPKDVDFDFIVEKLALVNLPVGWKIKKNSYGNPKFVGKRYEIDMVPVNNIHSVLRRGFKPTIKNYLTGTPLNVQSIAFDIRNNRIIGEIGKKAIKNKVVAVNNLKQAEYSAKLKHKTVKRLVTDIADQFGFKAVYK